MKAKRPAPKKKSAKRRRPLRPTPKPRPVNTAGRTPVPEREITLTRTRGTPDRGAGPDGEAWRIDAAGKRAGVVFINVIDEPPVGKHASIQIYLNASSQGRRIGRVGYRKACEQSKHPEIYAHMRHENIASIRAAQEAGFVDATPAGTIQVIMVWKRPTTGSAPPVAAPVSPG
jgi:RimJ/RimL family protein N-acetyltransferase